MRDLTTVDWTTIPAPVDDGATKHLCEKVLPNISLPATDGKSVNLSLLTGITVIYVYPRTGRPDVPSLDGWDMIPGAKGCTPQSCSFRDHFAELQALGVNHLFGLSTQDTPYQQEVVKRLHLPFHILSDEHLLLTEALKLPTFETNSIKLLKRFTLVIQNGIIKHVFYPIFPPDNNAKEVIEWFHLSSRGRKYL